MQNLYEIIKGSLYFNKFLIDDLVCVEYTCPLEGEQIGIYTKYDYIIHVLSGKKTWKTIHGEWEIKAGETIYIKKGAAIIKQFFDEDFCMLGFFLPDSLIRESIAGSELTNGKNMDHEIHQFTAANLGKELYLDAFFQSMLTYFRSEQQPVDSIIKLKLKELLLNIIVNNGDSLLVPYLSHIRENKNPSLTHIMETNYCFNLNMDQFAQLCHRSLSTFKRDFQSHYNTTPGKWLLVKRLDHAANLLVKNEGNVTQVAFDCGFEDVSHFSRVFKDKFNAPPSNFRKISA
jgi:AraC-like DNA-binding protein